ncbi:hypothetical protein LguiB_032492 [Lonicera macranthoides]
MAFQYYSSSLLVILVTLLSLSIFAVPSQALVSNGQIIGQVLIGGTAICANSIPPAGGTQGVIPQAPVELRCGSGSTETVLKSTLTDISGIYSFAFATADTFLFDPNTCFIKISIPPNTCSIPIPNGFLRVPFGVLGVVQTLLGNLLVLIPGPITYVANRAKNVALFSYTPQAAEMSGIPRASLVESMDMKLRDKHLCAVEPSFQDYNQTVEFSYDSSLDDFKMVRSNHYEWL